MCGILYAKRRDNRPVANSLWKRFEKQRSRGTDGFGYLTIVDGKIKNIVRTMTEGAIETYLKKETASEILFHHRLPTSTPNFKETTHPIVIKHTSLKYNYYLVHNGVIRNHAELKEKHEKDYGFVYSTEVERVEQIRSKGVVTSEIIEEYYNDSECLAIEIALYLENKKTTIDTEGTASFVCIQTDKKNRVKRIHYGRNSGNPLVVEDNNALFFLKSSGWGKDLPVDTLVTIDYKTGETVENSVDIGRAYVSNINYNSRGYVDSPSDEDDRELFRGSGVEGVTRYLDSGEENEKYFSEERYKALCEESDDLDADLAEITRLSLEAEKLGDTEEWTYQEEQKTEVTERLAQCQVDLQEIRDEYEDSGLYVNQAGESFDKKTKSMGYELSP